VTGVDDSLSGKVSPVDCAFCDRLAGGNLVAQNALAVAFLDAFPLSPGHCLVVSRRHEPSFLALTSEEQAAVWALVAPVQRYVEAVSIPDGYNIGINVGEVAGQTVAHAHLHVIPRRRGDVPDPRGGIRWVIPPKARYWEVP
jgi:diadenosine tetraphosphate (Ap4A) HIT family hydrolase